MSERLGQGNTESARRPLVLVHVGDLHLTALTGKASRTELARQATLRADLRAILEEIGALATGRPEFVYLPGDIAEDAEAAAYVVLEQDLRETLFRGGSYPLHLIPGDHDRQHGTLGAFEAFRRFVQRHGGALPEPVVNPICHYPEGRPAKPVDVKQFYYAVTVGDVHCLFLDVITAGFGRKGFGLDFRLGPVQSRWIEEELVAARARRQPCAVFMHCYPHDLRDRNEQADLAALLWDEGVTLVEMGHTHYNELAPDGRTLYAAARSVGQNEDGPVGYAVAAIDTAGLDGPVVSWRFKQLQLGLPFVLITSPADRRLATGPLHLDAAGEMEVRAVVLADEASRQFACACSLDGGRWQPMIAGPDGTFRITVPWRDGSKHIAVRATALMSGGRTVSDTDTIEPALVDRRPTPMPAKPGSDEQALGAWPAKGIRGDQAGPNRSGYRW